MTHHFWCDLLPVGIVLDTEQCRIRLTIGKREREGNLEHTALDHDLHSVGGHTGELVDGKLERCGGQIGVELDVVGLSCMLDVHCQRGHDCAGQGLGGTDASRMGTD